MCVCVCVCVCVRVRVRVRAQGLCVLKNEADARSDDAVCVCMAVCCCLRRGHGNHNAAAVGPLGQSLHSAHATTCHSTSHHPLLSSPPLPCPPLPPHPPLQDEFPGVFRFTGSVFPSEDDDVVTSPYNAMLALGQLVEHADCVLPIENQALIDIVNRTEAARDRAAGAWVRGCGGVECVGVP